MHPCLYSVEVLAAEAGTGVDHSLLRSVSVLGLLLLPPTAAPAPVLHGRYRGEHGNLRGAVRRLREAGLLDAVGRRPAAVQPLGRGRLRGRARGLLVVLDLGPRLLQLALQPVVGPSGGPVPGAPPAPVAEGALLLPLLMVRVLKL